MAQSAADFEKALLDEYGKWVAVETVYVGNVRAFNVGDAVPHSHVTRGVVKQSQVKSTVVEAPKA